MNEKVVLEKIISDAENESNKIIESANQEIENMNQNLIEYEKSLKEKSNLEIEKYKRENQELYSSNLEFNKNKLVLEIKNSVLNDFKKTALSKIKNYQKDELLTFLNQILLKNAENNEKLLFNIDNITESDLKKLDAVKSLNLVVVADNSIQEGMILTTEIYDKNLSFENIVLDLFDKKKNEICEELF